MDTKKSVEPASEANFESSSDRIYQPYYVPLTDFARTQRDRHTLAERTFWFAVRAKRFQNLKFIRQKPLLGYIADFYCAEYQLVIELDGGYHARTQEYDQERTDRLNSRGITVIRYQNGEVINHLPEVLRHLWCHLQALSQRDKASPPEASQSNPPGVRRSESADSPSSR